MDFEYLSFVLQGFSTTLWLTFIPLGLAFLLAIFFTIILSLQNKICNKIINLYILFFTGTPMLVQILLIYNGPGQFEVIKDSFIWPLLSEAWFCAMVALTLNSAAYTTLIFYGALKAIPKGQWEACASLGQSKLQTLSVLLPYALYRALPTYSNEIILLLKGTALVSTITIMDMMGYARQLAGTTYNAIGVFSMAGLIYLVLSACLYLIARIVERKLLVFEYRK